MKVLLHWNHSKQPHKDRCQAIGENSLKNGYKLNYYSHKIHLKFSSFSREKKTFALLSSFEEEEEAAIKVKLRMM